MKRTPIILSIAIIACGLLYPASSFADSKSLTIVFSGDMRGEIENCHCPKEDFGGLPRRARYIAEVKREKGDILLLDTGDVLPLPTPQADKRLTSYNAFISLKAMGMMGYDAMNVGESDLIFGETFLAEKEKSLSFPLISASIVDYDTEEPFFRPYTIKTMKNGLRIGILGLLNERYVINSSRLTIAPYRETAARYIPELKDRCDILIVLAHIGLPYSKHLAEYIGEDIDLILSGHWDTDSQEPLKIGRTLVMPTSYHSRKIGRLDLKIKDGSIVSYKWESVPLGPEFDGPTPVKALVSMMPSKEKKTDTVYTEEEKIERIASERPLRVMVFYSPGCRACMEVERDILPEIEKKYGDKILLRYYDVSVSSNYEQMVRLEDIYGVEDGGYVPEVIVSKYVLKGKEDIASNLDAIIQKALSESRGVKKNISSAADVEPYHPPAPELILSRFQSFSILTVVSAGLLDGINPCAFTSIVFFISFLALVGYRKKEMVLAGLSFALAVFIAYLLIGMGIFRCLRALKGFSYVSAALNISIAVFTAFLGVLSLVDFIRFKRSGRAGDIILKLPDSVKNRIRGLIGSDFRDAGRLRASAMRIAWVAFSAGFIVSVLESFCTGQVYLPTIAFVLKIPDKKLSAFLYLIIYNFAFILPLIAVFMLALYGATSKTFSGFMERHLGAIKILTALLFFSLAAFLLIYL